MITVIITKKHMQYPGYDTYTAYEFLQINAERLRNVEMVLIAERMNTKKLRKIRNRMNAFNIVEINMLPEDVIDVAEARVVHLPHSGIYVDIKENASPDEMRKTLLGALRQAADKLLKETGFDPSMLERPKLNTKLRSALDQDHALRKLDEDILNSIRKLGPDIRLPFERLLDDPKRRNFNSDALHVSEPGIKRMNKYTTGAERTVKVKPWLSNPQVVRLFKSKQELAEYLVAKLPKGTDIRKCNALKFKICVEMKEMDVLNLAGDEKLQLALVNKYC